MTNRATSRAQYDSIETLISLLKVATRIASPMRDNVADPEGLSVTELRIVLALGGEGPLAGHALAEFMAMQPMNVSRALATLGKMGLVEAVEDASNRRHKPHRLSEAGQGKFKAMQPEMKSVADFVFGGMDSEERKQVAQLLGNLDARLAAWEPNEPHRHVPRA